jgi:hypothetical protein
MKLTELRKLAGLPVTEAAVQEVGGDAVRADKDGFTWELSLTDAINYIIQSTYGDNARGDRQAIKHRADLTGNPRLVDSWIRNASSEDIGKLNWELIESPRLPDLRTLDGGDFDGIWLASEEQYN